MATPTAPLIFGKEPAAVIGTAEAAVAFALTLQIFHLSTNLQGIIMAVVVAVAGLWGAWATQTTMLGALVAVVKAGAALAVVYGFPFTDTQQAMAISTISIGLGLFYRTQTSPVLPTDPAVGLVPGH